MTRTRDRQRRLTGADARAHAMAAMNAWLLAKGLPDLTDAEKIAVIISDLRALMPAHDHDELPADSDAALQLVEPIDVSSLGFEDGQIRALASPHAAIVAQEDMCTVVYPIDRASIDQDFTATLTYVPNAGVYENAPVDGSERPWTTDPRLIDEDGRRLHPHECGVVEDGTLFQIRGGVS